jgi:hypothetical protein
VRGGVSLVEIDLVRTGEWVLAMPYEERLDATYRVVVRRAWTPRDAEYYRVSLTEKLPTILVPLRPADTDVPLDLQALIDQCYRNGGYDDIDYASAPQPPLAPPDARWASRLLRDLGLRPGRKRNKKKRS